MDDLPYPHESWQQFADAQLDHERTIEQCKTRDKRHSAEALAALRTMLRGY